MSGPEAVFGRMPEIEDEVYIDFGDSFYARPELRGEVEDISDDGIMVNGEWIAWEEIVHVEVTDDWI